jgi:hypothetical protein
VYGGEQYEIFEKLKREVRPLVFTYLKGKGNVSEREAAITPQVAVALMQDLTKLDSLPAKARKKYISDVIRTESNRYIADYESSFQCSRNNLKSRPGNAKNDERRGAKKLLRIFVAVGRHKKSGEIILGIKHDTSTDDRISKQDWKTIDALFRYTCQVAKKLDEEKREQEAQRYVDCIIADEEFERDAFSCVRVVDCYIRLDGNRSAIARELGVTWDRVKSGLLRIGRRLRDDARCDQFLDDLLSDFFGHNLRRARPRRAA